MRVLVTGGSGFVGQHVVRALLARGDEVVVADLRPFPDASAPIHQEIGDLREPERVAAAFNHDVNAVVHLAAITSVLQSVNDPDGVFRTNVLMTHLLLEQCRLRDVDRFVFASTNAVVGNIGSSTINENSPLAPLTPYGATKASAEMLLSAYAASYSMTSVALRFTNVYGIGMQLKDSVIARMMKAALVGGSIEIYGNGEQVRDYIFVTDAVASLLLGLALDTSNVLTIGSARSVSMNALHRLACDATETEIGATHVAGKPGEMPAVIVDTSLARSLGFSPAFTLEEGLRATWLDFRR
ncbi:MAG TPA: NAD-dependent epimerase/dehydratase family protein [Acidimicrobiales bacterium]|nr:NAD-dependent epimerase/dehydratase family protein [Acidimicrobiales bacterium]